MVMRAMRSFLLRLAAAALSGGLLAISFTDGPTVLAWIGLAPVLYAVASSPRIWGALVCALTFCAVWILPALYFTAKQSTAGWLALSVYTSLYYILALIAFRYLPRLGLASAVFGTAALWACMEIARSRMPVIGFPWLLMGHLWVDYPTLRQGADLLGVYGLSFTMVLFNAALAFALPNLKLRLAFLPPPGLRTLAACLAAPLLLLGALFLYGHLRIGQLSPKLERGPTIAVLQGMTLSKQDRSSAEKAAQLEQHLALHAQALENAPANDKPVLVCWAETMVPGVYNRDDYSSQFEAITRTTGVPALGGIEWIDTQDVDLTIEDQRWYNGVQVLDAHGEPLARYAKRRLVPFGEYIPWTNTLPFLKSLRSVTNDTYTRGETRSPVVEVGGVKLAFNICIEDAYPELAREAAKAGADLYVNLTNDGWFVGTSGPAMHLKCAALRAVEVRRPLLRVNNAQYSVLVDPLGQVDTLVQPDEVGVGYAHVERLSEPVETLAMRMGEVGAVTLFLLVFVGAVLFDRNTVRNPLPMNKLQANK